MEHGREVKMYGMDVFLLESVELWKAWNQIIFYVPNYYCVIVLQESWDHIDRALVFSFYFSFSHSTGEIICV